MPIQFSTVPITFTGGLQKKTDPLTLQSPALLKLDNAMFNKVGALNKRPGYDILNNTILNGSAITSASSIANFNNELTLFDNQNIYTYISSNKNWVNRGIAISLINTNNQIIRNASQQINPDSNYINGIELFTWEDSRGGVRYSVIDKTTNAYCIADQLVSGVGAKPKVIIFNNLFYIFYTDQLNNLFYRTVNPSNPSVIVPQTNILSDGYNNFAYDVVSANNRLYIANECTDYLSSNFIKLRYLDASNNVSAPTTIITNPLTTDVNCISITSTSDTNIWVSWGQVDNITSLIYTSAWDINLNPVANYIVEAGLISTIASIESQTPGTIQLVYEFVNNNPSNNAVKTITANYQGITTFIGTKLSVGLASKPFKYNNQTFIQLAHQSSLQSTYFMTYLTQSPFTIVGKVAQEVGGGLRTNGMLPEVSQPNSGQFLWPNLVKGIFISQNNTSYSLLGVNSTLTDFTNTNKFNSTTYSNNLLFVGGIVQSYDGSSCVEQNFNLYPEGISYSNVPFSGALSAGQYQYQVVYAWTDKFGQIQYSTPSVPITITTAQNDSVIITIPTLRLTAKTGVIIKIYRTQVNQTTFQEVTSELNPLFNSTVIDSVSFTDSLADFNIASNQTIYTTGGILENASPPSCSLITLFQDRVMLSGLEDPNLIWYSKNKFDNSNFNTIPVEFSESLTIAVSQIGGPITALGVMDQNLIIFKKSAIFIMNGDGVNDAGGGNNFATPQLVTQDVGCINSNSIRLTQQGLYFQTPNDGIWMIDRSLGAPSYIGAGVDDIAKDNLVSSVTKDDNSNSIIFTTYDGLAMVYDYLVNQWSTFTNHKAVSSTNFNGSFTFVKSNGSVYKQNINQFYDGIVAGLPIPYKMELTTPWISYAQPIGYMSMIRMYIKGTYKGIHNLQVNVGYDDNPAFIKQGVINPNITAGSNLWGSDGYWGQSTPWGGTWEPYMFRVNLSRPRCTSIRFNISDIQSSPTNEGFSISSLLFEVAAMPGGFRMPVSHSMGTK